MSAPVSEQAPWLAQGEDKRTAVREMFADIAPSYDLLNSLMCLRQHKRWRRIAVAELSLSPGAAALDVCCGTGDFLAPLRRAVGGGLLVGSDFCLPMLDRAQQKAPDAPLSLGDACRLPFADASFDAVTVGWGIRNVPDADLAHREAFRVLKPGGRFVSLDMARPENRLVRSVSGWFMARALPGLGSLFGRRRAYTYLPQSTQRFMSRTELRDSMRAVGFVDVRWRDFALGNICMHTGRKP